MVDALATKTVTAAIDHGVASVALGGGVAANRALRRTLDERLAAEGLALKVPPPAWCTDNGAMIGAAAGFQQKDNPSKLRSSDIAHAVRSVLEMDDRGFTTELTVFATNPVD